MLIADRQDLEVGLHLFEAHQQLGAFDAILAAVGINRHVQALISADRAFAGIPGLTWIDPLAPALERLLGQ